MASAHAQTVLTVDRVLDLAERQNPEVLVARARTVQAEGALTTARARFATNPEADLFLGSRDTEPGGRIAGTNSPSLSVWRLVVNDATASLRPVPRSISGSWT